MSLVTALARQSLIAQRNNLQFAQLQNSAAQRRALSFKGSLEEANMLDNEFNMENINNSVQLMAINAELNALNNSKLNYLA